MFILFTYLLYIFKTIAIFVKRNCGCFAQGGMAEHGLHVVRFFVSACCGRGRTVEGECEGYVLRLYGGLYVSVA